MADIDYPLLHAYRLVVSLQNDIYRMQTTTERIRYPKTYLDRNTIISGVLDNAFPKT